MTKIKYKYLFRQQNKPQGLRVCWGAQSTREAKFYLDSKKLDFLFKMSQKTKLMQRISEAFG